MARALRRLCCERLNDALETLDKASRLEAVHEVRMEIKKLRSILRLMRGEIGKKTYRRHNGALREAADLLTALRDAQVTLGAFDKLTKQGRRKPRTQPFPEIRRALRESCTAEENKLSRTIAPLKRILQESKEELDRLKIKSRGWHAIGPGLKRIYSRGREACETAGRQPADENFHEWRKRVKDLWHELRLLGPANPRGLHRRANALKKLGALLGDDHDLFMLRDFVAKKFGAAQDGHELDHLVIKRQRTLRSAAIKQGKRIYREKPGHFCRRMEEYWKNWRGKA